MKNKVNYDNKKLKNDIERIKYEVAQEFGISQREENAKKQKD